MLILEKHDPTNIKSNIPNGIKKNGHRRNFSMDHYIDQNKYDKANNYVQRPGYNEENIKKGIYV